MVPMRKEVRMTNRNVPQSGIFLCIGAAGAKIVAAYNLAVIINSAV